jgi:pilus assembly protein CpaF
MRPDRIIMGEVRGEEAFDMLQAMNTGHEGSMTTVHANTPRDAVARLESMVHGQHEYAREIRSPADSLGHHHRRAGLAHERRQRKVTSISEITGMEENIICMQEIF